MSFPYCVYWVDSVGPHADLYEQLNDAVYACEYHRKQGHSYVTMAIEDPNHAGKMGVSETDETYTWTKRRPPEPPSGRKLKG